jgi:hypothetical protein
MRSIVVFVFATIWVNVLFFRRFMTFLLQCLIIMLKLFAKIFIIAVNFFFYSQNQIWKSTERRWFLSNLDAYDWFSSARAKNRRSLIEHEFWWSSFSNNQKSSENVSWASSSDFFLDFDEIVAHAWVNEYNAHLKIKWTLRSR